MEFQDIFLRRHSIFTYAVITHVMHTNNIIIKYNSNNSILTQCNEIPNKNLFVNLNSVRTFDCLTKPTFSEKIHQSSPITCYYCI